MPAGEIMQSHTIDVTILAGTGDVEARQTMMGGVVQESAWDIAPSMTQVKVTNSIGNHGSRVGEETVGVTILTGTKAVKTRQTVTSGVVQGSTWDIVLQSSAQVTTTEVSGNERSGNRVMFAEVEEQGGGSRLSTRENTKVGMVQQSATELSMQLTAKSSSQQTTTDSLSTLQTTTESSMMQTATKLSTLQSATGSSTQSLYASARLDMEVSVTGVVNDTILLTGQSGTRESATNETVVQGSTQGISQSSTQVTKWWGVA